MQLLQNYKGAQAQTAPGPQFVLEYALIGLLRGSPPAADCSPPRQRVEASCATHALPRPLYAVGPRGALSRPRETDSAAPLAGYAS